MIPKAKICRCKVLNVPCDGMFMYDHLVFRHDLHWRMWDWLSKNPSKSKEDFFELNPALDLLSSIRRCFACAFAETAKILGGKEAKKESVCRYCPFKVELNCSCLNGLYSQWRSVNSLAEAASLARQIRDFPLNPAFGFKETDQITQMLPK